MSTQQDIYAAGSESRPPMLNKENYVPWSSRLLRYAKSRPNGKLIHNSILNGPYVRRMIAEPGDGERDVNVNETFHEQTDDELRYQYLDDMKRLSNSEYRDEIKIAGLKENFNGMSIEIRKQEKLQQLDQWANLSTSPSKHFNSFCYDDDDDKDYTIAIIPVLSTEDPDNSLSMRDEHLDTVSATESDEVIKSSVENLIPILRRISSTDDDSLSIDNIGYVEASPPDSKLVGSEVMEIVIPEIGGIDDDILLTIKDDILYEKLLNVNLLIAKIKALNDNPIPSSDFKTKSSSTSLNSLLEETNTFDNSLPEFETFCFDVEEISSGSTTTHSDISLPEYEVFYDNHVKEISSGSPTTHSDSPLYESFIFDLSINPFPLANRSDFYEFADELIHFISPPEYDCFLFKVKPNSRDFTMDVVVDISPTKEPIVPNALPTHPTLQLNLKFQPFSESLFTYVVWIFLPFLVYSVAPQYLLSLRIEEPFLIPAYAILILSRPDVSHRCGTFLRFNVLNESPMDIFSSTCSPMDQ
nr:ribonuclease H-like domain-containing protein [Tanacetum cinerariifolium]